MRFRAVEDICAVAEHLEWMTSVGMSSRTVTDRRGTLERLSRWLETRPGEPTLLRVVGPDLSAWHRSLHRFAPQSVSTYVGHVKGFYGWLRLERDYPDVAGRLRRPRLPRRVPRPIPDAALQLALQSAGPRVLRCLLLMAFCGLRVGEVARLYRRELRDTADPPVVVVHGKGGRTRVVPLPVDVVGQLRSTGLPLSGPVVRTSTGRALTPNQVSQIVNGHLHQLGIPETAHALRHWYATRSYRITRDLRLVQELLGHEDPSTTSGYAAYDPAGVAVLLAELDRSMRSLLAGV
jgi:integrase